MASGVGVWLTARDSRPGLRARQGPQTAVTSPPSHRVPLPTRPSSPFPWALATQVRLGRDTLRISALPPNGVAKRPALLSRLGFVRCSRGLSRRRWMALAGSTEASASCCPDHTRHSEVRKKRPLADDQLVAQGEYPRPFVGPPWGGWVSSRSAAGR